MQYSEIGPGVREDYDHFSLFADTEINSTRNWMQVLYGLARANGARSIVEIGVMQGVTTSMLALALRQNGGGRLTAVDINPANLDIARARVARNGLTDLVQFVQGDSHSVATVEFDLLFIDGDHSYEGCAGDWEHWAPRAGPGGIVCIHDTRDARIARFLSEGQRFAEWQVINFDGDCGMAILRRRF